MVAFIIIIIKTQHAMTGNLYFIRRSSNVLLLVPNTARTNQSLRSVCVGPIGQSSIPEWHQPQKNKRMKNKHSEQKVWKKHVLQENASRCGRHSFAAVSACSIRKPIWGENKRNDIRHGEINHVMLVTKSSAHHRYPLSVAHYIGHIAVVVVASYPPAFCQQRLKL